MKMEATLRSNLIHIAHENRQFRALLLPVLSGKTAGESTLVERAIRLAHANPELRKIVLPSIKVALDPSYGQAKKPSAKAQKTKKRMQDIRDDANASKAAIDMKEKLLEHYGEDFRVAWGAEGSRGDDISITTLIGYASDKDNQHKEEARKILDDLKKKIWSDNVKSFFGGIKDKAINGVKTAATATSNTLLRGAGGMSEWAGKKVLDNTRSADEIRGQMWKDATKAFGNVMGAYTETVVSQMEKIGANADPGVSGKAIAMGKQAGLGVAGLIGGVPAGVVGVAAGGGAALVEGAIGGIGAGVQGLVGKGLMALGKSMKKKGGGASRTASDLVDGTISEIAGYLGDIGKDELEEIAQFMEEDGSFDQKGFEKHLKDQEKILTDSINEVVEKAKKELAKKEEEAKEEEAKEEEAKEEQAKKEEAKEEETKKKEMKEKFVAKKAVVKMAYENPKYRPQILQLLQVPRTHYAIADIREIISNG